MTLQVRERSRIEKIYNTHLMAHDMKFNSYTVGLIERMYPENA